jgi:hypothetical protein
MTTSDYDAFVHATEQRRPHTALPLVIAAVALSLLIATMGVLVVHSQQFGTDLRAALCARQQRVRIERSSTAQRPRSGAGLRTS